MFGRAFLIRSIGFLLGNLVGSTVYERVVLDAAAFSVIGTAVFVLLVLVTFNMNSEKYAKTVWGLLPHEIRAAATSAPAMSAARLWRISSA